MNDGLEVVSKEPDTFVAYLDNFIVVSEAERLRQLAEQTGYKQADVRQADGSYKMIPEYRNNERASTMLPELANEWYDGLKDYLPPVIRMNSPTRLHPFIKFYKYKIGDYFNWHKDGPTIEGNEKSKITFMIYLSDYGFTHFKVNNGEFCLESKEGRMVIFNHKVEHSSPPLDRGVKITLRSDVMYKLNLPE